MRVLPKLAGVLVLGTWAGSTAAAQAVAGGKYAIQVAKGNYLTAVGGGNVSGRTAINSDATRISGWETFTLVPQSDGSYAIRTMSGHYLTALSGGGIGGGKVAIHTNATQVSGWEKFGVVRQGDGSHAIRTSNGRYLTAVSGGGIGSTGVAIHTDATQVSGWEKFRLAPLDAGPSCPANIVNSWWHLVNSNPPQAFFALTGTTWTSKEISHGDPTRRDFWGNFKCVGVNTWEFWNANGVMLRKLEFRSDGKLYNLAKSEVYIRG